MNHSQNSVTVEQRDRSSSEMMYTSEASIPGMFVSFLQNPAFVISRTVFNAAFNILVDVFCRGLFKVVYACVCIFWHCDFATVFVLLLLFAKVCFMCLATVLIG